MKTNFGQFLAKKSHFPEKKGKMMTNCWKTRSLLSLTEGI